MRERLGNQVCNIGLGAPKPMGRIRSEAIPPCRIEGADEELCAYRASTDYLRRCDAVKAI